MKIKIISMLALIVIILTLSAKNADAQCPSGYNAVTITMQIYGCNYDVKFCVKCATGPVPASISIIGIMPHPDCQLSLPFQDVYEEIYNEATTWQFIQANLCNSTLPPCNPGPPTTVTYDTWLCWKVTKIEYFGNVTYYYGPCNTDSKCVQAFEYCMQGTTIVRTPAGSPYPFSVGTPSCYLQGWQITLPSQINEESECFIINTACTP